MCENRSSNEKPLSGFSSFCVRRINYGLIAQVVDQLCLRLYSYRELFYIYVLVKCNFQAEDGRWL